MLLLPRDNSTQQQAGFIIKKLNRLVTFNIPLAWMIIADGDSKVETTSKTAGKEWLKEARLVVSNYINLASIKYSTKKIK